MRIRSFLESGMGNTRIAVALFALACGSAQSAALSKQDYQDAKKRIAAEYQVERQKCGERHANALDKCVARAHGARDVARAELEAQYKPGPRTNYDAALARANAAYAIAKEECDDKRGDEKKACRAEAKAALARAKTAAKAAMKAPN
jgi:hypothetical protein